MGDLIITNLTQIFQDICAVRDINISAFRGEFIAILGPSGCGKTTILRAIAGLDNITNGNIIVDGNTITSLPPWKREVAMVFQSQVLYPHLNVHGNLMFGLRARRISQEISRNKIQDLAKRFHIDHLLRRRVKGLSGGEAQRIAIVKALLQEAKILLLDEPLSNIDANLRAEIRIELLKYHSGMNSITVYVTHDQVEAMTLANRLVILNKGVVQQIGNPNEIYDNPANTFVAQFIGNPGMNIIECDIMNISDEVWCMKEGKKLVRLMPSILDTCKGNPKILIGIRPESIKMTKSNKTGSGALQGTVKLVENMGYELIIYLAMMGSVICMRALRQDAIHNNERVQISFEVDKIHLFNPQDGNVIGCGIVYP